MAAAAEPGGHPRKRRSSLELLPPNISSSSADSNVEFFDTNRKEVKPGDLIQIFRDGDNHWAVYVGGGNVVHLIEDGRGSSSSSSIGSRSSMSLMGSIDVGVSVGKVLKEKLQDVVKKDRWRVNNRLGHKYKPRPANVIVKKACSLVDTKKKFNLEKYNSKDFATEMRYGKTKSQQRKFAAGIKPGAAEVEAARAAARAEEEEQKKRERTSKRSSKLSSSSADSNREFFDMDQKEVKPGDLIQIYHGYQHWGVYVGGGNVVHFVTPGRGSRSSRSSSFMSFMSSVGVGVDGKVLKEKLQDVVKKDKWRVNNLLDHKYKPRPANIIVKEACSLKDTKMKYHLFMYNSEHFVTEMRYDHPESRQVKDAAIGVAVGVGVAAAVAGAAGAVGAAITGVGVGVAAAAVWIAGLGLKKRRMRLKQ
ncbi:uncharacterized protein LOC133442098 [Cololabis saira]|uniref:uncharacterized protein LOC133442098 n=1 Tax=Cololabis saira TaxID=129043 RepID=UPI002AD229CE|nr:uncharacterized protein LOC133442098 [Cololabis saira]